MAQVDEINAAVQVVVGRPTDIQNLFSASDVAMCVTAIVLVRINV